MVNPQLPEGGGCLGGTLRSPAVVGSCPWNAVPGEYPDFTQALPIPVSALVVQLLQSKKGVVPLLGGLRGRDVPDEVADPGKVILELLVQRSSPGSLCVPRLCPCSVTRVWC